MFKKIAFIILGIILQTPVFSAENYPVLSDRVVDEAGILDSNGFQQLRRMLQQFEDKTGTQIVVAVLKNLRENEISDYSVNLARHWQIGQKGKNNGLMLLIAMEEKKMRIEVGYGLEGQMTDARSKYIIETIIKPEFKAGNYQEGLLRGALTIIQILSDEKTAEIDQAVVESEKPHRKKSGSSLWFNLIIWIIIIVYIIFRALFGRSHYSGRGGFTGGGFSGGGFSGGGGGGFSGGGGSFGGGGASGSW